MSRGLACVAIVGARKSAVGGPAWKAVGVRDRDVVIVLDGDAATNPEVSVAEKYVISGIELRGGRVTVRRLPIADRLDDYLAAHPVGDAEDLIANLPRPAPDEGERRAENRRRR